MLQVAAATAAAGAVFVSIDWWRQAGLDAATADTLQERIERRGGFSILMQDLQKRIGPSVILPDRPVAITDLGADRLGPLRNIEVALAPYPPGFVARFVSTLALAGDVVFFNDTPVGGFFFTRGICLNAGNPADAGDVTTRLFHHELSSLVRSGTAFDDARWQGFNPPGFHYLDEAAYRALLKNPHEDGDAALNEQGFTRPYGESDIDNDFNTYAEAMFGDGPSFAALIKPYPRMRGKAAMLMDVYRAIDPAIGRYFETSGLAAAAGG